MRTALVLALALWLPAAAAAFDLQGHRGARGLAPENTLAGFATALRLGVSTLELDVVVTADDIVVVSHDRQLNAALTRGPDGKWLAEEGPSIRSLTADRLAAYDIGRIDPASRYAQRLPEQVPVDGQRLPWLIEVFAFVARTGNDSVRFNIETKLSPLAPDESVDPERFAELLVETVREAGMAHRVAIQSFDWRTLRAANRLAPAIPTSCLTVAQSWLDNLRREQPGPSPWTAGLDVDEALSLPHLARAAGCRLWSPYYKEVDAMSVKTAHRLGLAVVPWTVNQPQEMAAQIAMGVDGLITDYPDRLRKVLAAHGIELPAATPVEP